MTRLVIELEVQDARLQLLMAQGAQLVSQQEGRFRVLEQPPQATASTDFDPTQKVDKETFLAMPEPERMAYIDAQGGIFSVMADHGVRISDELYADWVRMREEEDREWAIEYRRRYGRKLPEYD